MNKNINLYNLTYLLIDENKNKNKNNIIISKNNEKYIDKKYIDKKKYIEYYSN